MCVTLGDMNKLKLLQSKNGSDMASFDKPMTLHQLVCIGLISTNDSKFQKQHAQSNPFICVKCF